MSGTLSISLPLPSNVIVARDPLVPEAFWNHVLAEWGERGGWNSQGTDPNQALRVPIEDFLSNLEWVVPLCQRYQVGIAWDDGARDVVGRLRAERGILRDALNTPVALSVEQISERLAGGRFARLLLPFQIRDLGRLLSLRHGANFSVPGAGKTTVAYATYEAERLSGRVDRLLVVAPLSAYDAWVGETSQCFRSPLAVHRCSNDPIPDDTEVCVVNYQRLSGNYSTIAEWVMAGRSHIILDEAHRMKRGWTGEWGRSALSLAHLATRRDVLTGTPAPQSLRDLDAILDFVWPTQARRILPEGVFASSPPPGLAQHVGERIGPLFARTTKSELGLPTPTLRRVPVHQGPIQAAIYAALRNNYAGTIAISRADRATFAQLGQIVMYLLEAASNPNLLPLANNPSPLEVVPQFPLLDVRPGSTLAELLARYRLHEVSPKFTAAAQILRENQQLGRKTLLWTNFVANISVLEEMFQGLRPAVIHGGIPSEVTTPSAHRTREQELERFRTDGNCLLLLANPAAMSEGVSLHQHCHDAIYFDRTFNAGHYLQSVDRIHRLGLPQDAETCITFLITEGTIDEIVDSRVWEKADRLGAVLNDPDIAAMALPDDDANEELLLDEDIEALFQHLRNPPEPSPAD